MVGCSIAPAYSFWNSSLAKNTETAAETRVNRHRMDIARLADAIRELKEQQAQAASLRASGVFGGARAKIASAASDAQHRVRREIEAAIERNPLTAALIAFIAGMWVGLPRRPRS